MSWLLSMNLTKLKRIKRWLYLLTDLKYNGSGTALKSMKGFESALELLHYWTLSELKLSWISKSRKRIQTEDNQLDGLGVFAGCVLGAQRVLAGVLASGIGQREVRVVVLVADGDALRIGQRDVVPPHPRDLRWRLARDVHRPLVNATHFDRDRLQRAAIDARFHCSITNCKPSTFQSHVILQRLNAQAKFQKGYRRCKPIDRLVIECKSIELLKAHRQTIGIDNQSEINWNFEIKSIIILKSFPILESFNSGWNATKSVKEMM